MAGKSMFSGLDLSAMFRTSKAEKPAPAVVAVVTMKGENTESIKNAVAEAGFSVDAMVENDDGSVVFKQEDYDGEVTVVRLSEDVAVVTKGFSPYNMDTMANGTSFADMCAAQQFYPGVSTIMDVMRDSIFNLAYNVESQKDVATAIGKLFDEAKAYTLSFVGALPSKAFKLEGDVVAKAAKAKTKAKTKPDATEDNEPGEGTVSDPDAATENQEAEVNTADGKKDPKKNTSKDCGTGMTADEKPKAKDAKKDDNLPAAEQETAKKDEQSAQSGLTAEDVSSIVASQIGTALKSITGDITSALKQHVDESTGTLAEALKAMKQDVDGLSERIQKNESDSAKVTQALKGVVSGADTIDDTHEVVAKSERPLLGEFDTAYRSGVRKTAQR